jgi:hypothetical protein
MEGAASGTGEALVGAMRALSRRGALLRRHDDGAGLIEQDDRKRPPRPVRPEEFLGMLDSGWLRQSGVDSFVISRRGVSALRVMLNRPTASAPPASQPKTAPPPSVARPKPNERPGINPRESPLAWLRQRRDLTGKPMISAIEFEAGEQLRSDFERSMLTQRVTASWDPTNVATRQSRGAPGAGLEMSEMVVLARQRVDAALKAVGPELGGVLLDVCCFLKGLEQAERNGGWPRRAGKVVLQLGLAHLARYYGIDRTGSGASSRVRSWGAPDYRPDVVVQPGSEHDTA